MWSTRILTPINGFVRVPESPGLGVTLDRDELERLKSLQTAGTGAVDSQISIQKRNEDV